LPWAFPAVFGAAFFSVDFFAAAGVFERARFCAAPETAAGVMTRALAHAIRNSNVRNHGAGIVGPQ
jgi:hypothetical protein